MSPDLEISVVICTLNRSRSLARTLRSIETAAQRVPDLAWELVIVDNGSNDDTASLVASFGRRLPILYTLERERGLSRARNHALQIARGDFLLCTDDDVEVAETWLQVSIGFLKQHPSTDMLAGRITPKFDPEPPQWITRNRDVLKYAFAECDYGNSPIKLSVSENRLPIGANFGVRRTLAASLRFDEALGVAPGRHRLGEETVFLSNLLKAGAVGWYVPTLQVFHLIEGDRQTTAYVDKYQRSAGETYALMVNQGATPNFLGGDLKGARTLKGLPIYFLRERLRLRLLELMPAPLATTGERLRWRMRRQYLEGALNHWKIEPYAP